MRRLSILLSLAVLSTAVVFAFGGRWPWQRLQERVMESPVTVHVPAIIESRDTLRRGETLGELFGRQGLLGANLVGMLEQAGLDPRRLRAGMVVNFRRMEGDSTPHEALVRTAKAKAKPDNKKAGEKSPAVRDLESKLTRAAGTKVLVKDTGNKGEVVIPYEDLDHLDRILARVFKIG